MYFFCCTNIMKNITLFVRLEISNKPNKVSNKTLNYFLYKIN